MLYAMQLLVECLGVKNLAATDIRREHSVKRKGQVHWYGLLNCSKLQEKPCDNRYSLIKTILCLRLRTIVVEYSASTVSTQENSYTCANEIVPSNKVSSTAFPPHPILILTVTAGQFIS